MKQCALPVCNAHKAIQSNRLGPCLPFGGREDSSPRHALFLTCRRPLPADAALSSASCFNAPPPAAVPPATSAARSVCTSAAAGMALPFASSSSKPCARCAIKNLVVLQLVVSLTPHVQPGHELLVPHSHWSPGRSSKLDMRIRCQCCRSQSLSATTAAHHW